EVARGDDDPLRAAAGRDALGRTAAVGRSRPRGDVEQPRRLPRRADGSARGRPDAPGARPRQAARRAGARRRARLPQPDRRLRGREPDHRAPARPQRRRLRAREDEPAGDRAGDHVRGADRRRGRGRGSGLSTAAPAEIQAAAAEDAGLVALLRARWEAFKGGDVGSLPVIVGIIAITAFQGSFVAFIGVPSFVVTLAGLLIWQGVILKDLGTQGVIGIQDRQINDVANYVLTKNTGWIVAIVFTAGLAAASLGAWLSRRRAGLPTGNPILTLIRIVFYGALAFAAVAVCNHSRGVPLVGLIILFVVVLGAYVAGRTT